jgi:hypothetical protein
VLEQLHGGLDPDEGRPDVVTDRVQERRQTLPRLFKFSDYVAVVRHRLGHAVDQSVDLAGAVCVRSERAPRSFTGGS